MSLIRYHLSCFAESRQDLAAAGGLIAHAIAQINAAHPGWGRFGVYGKGEGGAPDCPTFVRRQIPAHAAARVAEWGCYSSG